jgi:hypothetical protein
MRLQFPDGFHGFVQGAISRPGLTYGYIISTLVFFVEITFDGVIGFSFVSRTYCSENCVVP